MKVKVKNRITIEQHAKSCLEDWFRFKYDKIRKCYDDIHVFQKEVFIGALAHLIFEETHSISYTERQIRNIIKEKIGVNKNGK